MKNLIIVLTVFIVMHQVEIMTGVNLHVTESPAVLHYGNGENIKYESPTGVDFFKTLDGAIEAINYNQWRGVSIYKSEEIKLKQKFKTERVERVEEKTKTIYSVE